MRVLHVGKYFPPFAGGIENYLCDLLSALSADGVDCQALVHTHEPNHAKDKLSAAVTRVPTWFELAFTPIAPGFRRALSRLLAEWQPDLLHFHLPNPSAFWALSIGAARTVPWVIHWHSDVVTSPHDRRLRYLYPFYRPFEQAMLRRSAAIVATSPDYAQSSQALRQHQAHLTVIPLGVDTSRLTPTPGPSQWPDSNRMRVLAIGRLTYYKGFSVLLEAIGRLPDAQLIIVGSGSEKIQLQSLIERWALTDRVQLRETVDDPTRNALMRDCDVFCLPSIERTEAFGLVLLEAMQAGKPVIASSVKGSGMNWVVQQGENGVLCSPGDVNELATALGALTVQQRRDQLAAPAQTNFADKFSIKTNARLIQQLYGGLLADSDM